MAAKFAWHCSVRAGPWSQKPVIPHIGPRCRSSFVHRHTCRIGVDSSAGRSRADRDWPDVPPARLGGRVEQRTGVAAVRRGCRVVTTSMTARLLLGHQLRAIDEVSWSVVSGEAFEDAPQDLSVVVVPIRREFALSDFGAFVALWRYFRRQHF